MASPASSSLPLAGVRIFLHIRNAPTGHIKSKSGNSAKAILRAARLQVHELGASLALSEAAADLVVFHNGSPAALEALHAKYKAVVSPAYLAACLEADQRVSIAPFVVAVGDKESTAITAVARSPRGRRGSARTSASTPSQTPAVVSSNTGEKSKPTPKSSPASRSTRQASEVSKDASCTFKMAPVASTVPQPHPSRRLLLLLDDDVSVVNGNNKYASVEKSSSPAMTPQRSESRDVLSEEKLCQRASPVKVAAGASRPASLSQDVPGTEVFHEVSETPKRTPDKHLGSGNGSALHQKPQETLSGQPSHSSLNDTPSSATPKLAPPSGRGTSPLPSSLAVTQEMMTPTACASTHQQKECEEEEFLRHAVLCSTATAAVTRRRGRPRRPASAVPHTVPEIAKASEQDGGRSPLLIDDFRLYKPVKKAEKHANDPFLYSATSTQQQQQQPSTPPLLSISYSDVSSVAVTQPLTALEQPKVEPAGLHSSSRPQKNSHCSNNEAGAGQHVREGESGTLHATKRYKAEAAGKQSSTQRQRQRLLARRRSSAYHTKEKTHKESSTLQRQPHDDDSPEPPLSVTFSDVSRLQRLSDSDAAEVCVCFSLDEGEEREDEIAGSMLAVSAAQFAFLSDVVEQLGATTVGDDDQRWFRRSANGGALHVHPRKATHLVVSPDAALTPKILYFKALGIPIVTPQWVYDAIAIGGFPAVVPRLHAHPIFGDLESVVKTRNEKSVHEAVRREFIAADLLGDEDGTAVRERPAQSPFLTKSGNAFDAGAVGPPVPTMSSSTASPGGLSSTLRRLHKEVADEYVPAGEQAKRPYYRPIFQDCMFYLYVPPIDLVSASAPVKHTLQKERGNSSYLGDVAAALEQATQLIRVLGGTVTRNIASTFLDAVVDLTGFYKSTVEAGQQQQQCRALRESLSCAYHDALQRLSQIPAAYADALECKPKEAALAPPIVGISWLLYSVLQRQRADVQPFVLSAHPLSAQLAALHEGHNAAEERAGAKAEASLALRQPGDCLPDAGKAGTAVRMSVDTPTFSTSSLSTTSSSAPSPLESPPLRNSSGLTPSSSHPAHFTQESASLSPWPAVEVKPRLKCMRGPPEAEKHALQQLGTQEIAALLMATQKASSPPLCPSAHRGGKAERR
ncbi:hypothetical protein ABL78_0899 [Leptomonas seymouri]|uniref:BRCT domain-containing protein n=1 Tax=Leptomonas seymouri TaxID=5684 RepID=A0A0N0P8K3_LEPSE|nr:hypothetical protein ABL78_0899 [Leptomonas seymouri]|eukprot:KPI90039.1 hypothetical protein ABL78_0899 [Leptomonas seymouri]